MRWLKLIERTGLLLVGVLALIILLPLIILSLEVVLITGFLMLIGALGAKFSTGAHRLHTRWGGPRWAPYKYSGPKLGVN